MLTPLISFDVPESTGAVSFDNFLQKLAAKNIKVETKFRKFLETAGPCRPFRCNVYKAEKMTKFSDLLRSCQPLDASHLLAILEYIFFVGGSMLDIPRGEEEVNILVGPAVLDDEELVMGIEHEIERGEEKTQFHAWEPDHDEDDLVLVLKIV